MNKELINKIKKNSSNELLAPLSNSKIHGHKDVIPTPIPMLNVALSGSLDGGLTAGLTVIAGPSKHFKTSYALLMASAFLKKYPEGVILFYDTEFGATAEYFKSFGIDPEKVVHIPVVNVEEFTSECVRQLHSLKREDKVFILVDSIGNMPSRRELDNSLNENFAQDMSRAKSIKASFRQMTSYLNTKDVPMVAINHTYQTQELYSKAVVSGGTGIYYSADTILIIGRQQDKDGTEIKGWNFVINIEKSRVIKEKMKITINVSYETGIMKWSGLLENALEGQYVAKPSNGWYSKVNQETGEMEDKKYREKDLINNGEFWRELLANTDLAKYIEDKFTFGKGLMIQDDEIPLENLTNDNEGEEE
jgi:RecA/RadA recombinase